jgi:SAM-dependent methyltransferase
MIREACFLQSIEPCMPRADQAELSELHAISDLPRAIWSKVAHQLFAALPSTRILHIGADDPALVEALTARGLDAVGQVFGGNVLSSQPPGSRLTPARFQVRPGERFSTVVASVQFPAGTVSTPGSAGSAGGAAAAAADQIAAVARIADLVTDRSDRHAVVLLALPPDTGELTATTRCQIEQLFLTRGFRKHPARSLIDPQHAALAAFVFERLPATAVAAAANSPRAEGVLAQEQDGRLARTTDANAAQRCWRDLLIESGPSVDEALSRYAVAAQHVSRQDVVVDVGCGAGYGAAILHDAAAAARVIGIDDRGDALDYARSAYGSTRVAALTFQLDDLATLASIPDSSVDVVVALDVKLTPERFDRLLDSIVRVLLPGGRVIIDARCGRDASGEGQHCASFVDRLERVVRIERLFGCQPAHPNLIPFINAAQADEFDTDYWLAVGLKDPITHQQPRPDQIAHPRATDPELDLLAATEGFDNPWLAYGLVIGTRTASVVLLTEFARRTLERAPVYSGDHGAALCILAYRLFEPDNAHLVADLPLEQLLADYIAVPPHTPLELRWCISNAFVLARYYLHRGQLDAAEETFARCAALDGMAYRGLIATKTVDAAFWAGWLAYRRGAHDEARSRWESGIEAARRAVSDGWESCVGRRDISVPYGLREAGVILAAADRCSQALAWSRHDDERIKELADFAFRDL